MGYPFPGPVPYATNFPIHPQNYQPSRFVISGITLGPMTTVTTTTNMNYVIGQLCRLLIPQTFGCFQLNEAEGYVLSIPSNNQVVLGINSTGSNAFTSSSATTVAQILAIGNVNTGDTNLTPASETTYIPGSFINIS